MTRENKVVYRQQQMDLKQRNKIKLYMNKVYNVM